MALSYESFVTPAATVLAVLLTNALTYGRGNKEKLWELRRQAYSVILSELMAVEHICHSADEYIQENVHRYYEEEISRTHSREIWAQMGTLNDRYSKDYLILSSEFIALMDGFIEARSGGDFDLPPEAQDHFARAVREWRPKMLAQARSEMPFNQGPMASRLKQLLRLP